MTPKPANFVDILDWEKAGVELLTSRPLDVSPAWDDMADRLGKLDHLVIPADLDFERLTSLSYEGRQKLTDRRPRTLGEASRISGVSPSDLSVLMIYLGR